ncbi:hypothetical protein JKP88DRAFT_269227 [Tribonema minus]|uniref:Glycosyltransferase family 28 N-terminal domain-containing protein n=1 Tax=Tribonema minus TaxID=303371 RepID=A0A836C840_9STRA|nr:hypothetical protein JKP88DRAFT_269227 [Tribonema minus]
MNIVIMIVGTRGDVHPFFGLGHLLQQDGHRVRIATHVEFEKEVKAEGFEFYPLGGDPRRLSAFMVETSGRLLPNLMNQSERAGLPEKMNMLNEIIQSTWPACTAPEPSDPKQTPFIADAIISNPVTYAHIHCAEALSVPLHLFFPQPWTPTHEFPHPFASMSYERGCTRAADLDASSARTRARIAASRDLLECAENWYSYHMVDYLFHMGVSGYINDLRVNQMGLDPIRRGEHGFNLINNNHVPFVKMWSPNLVPKPKDWGPHIDVTGAFFTPPSKKAAAWEPPQDLVDFLAAGEPPIFVGFGSMVIDDVDSLLTAFLKAVEASGARMVLQSQWTAMIDARRHEAPPSVYPIGPAPHEWLLPRMGAVVHHGGAGTVAAGLRAGKPTLICPFFGDQFFWGQYVYERGVGPKPIPIRKVDAENLTVAFQELR